MHMRPTTLPKLDAHCALRRRGRDDTPCSHPHGDSPTRLPPPLTCYSDERLAPKTGWAVSTAADTARLARLPAHFRLVNRESVTPSRLYRSFSPGLSSSTGAESKCFRSRAKKRLSACASAAVSRLQLLAGVGRGKGGELVSD